MLALAILLSLPVAAVVLLTGGFRWKFLALFAMIITFQNLATMVLLKSGAVGIREGMLLLYVKEVVLALALTIEFIRRVLSGRISIDKTDMLCGVYLLYCIFHFAFLSGEIPLGFRLAGFRALAILPCIYLLGRWVFRRGEEGISLRFGRLYLGVAMAVAVVGIAEFFFAPDSFWIAIGQPEFYMMKVGFEGDDGSLYGNMYASFGDFFLRRAASLIADPIMSTYFIVFGMFVFTFVKPTSRLKWLVLCMGAAVCMGRSAILTFFAGVTEFYLHKRRIIPFGWFSILAVVALVAIPLLPVPTETLVNYLGTHYKGLANAMEIVKEKPLGSGIGSASNLVASLLSALGEEASDMAVGDTFIGSLVAQIGLPGLGLFLAFNFSLASRLLAMADWDQGSFRPISIYYRATAVFTMGVTVLSAINESGYGFISGGMGFLLAGLLTSEFYTRIVPASVKEDHLELRAVLP